MRVGVGVGAVVLGGCDAVAEAKARVLGETEVEVVEVVEPAAAEAPAPTVIATAPIAPEPLLLSREGVAGVVGDAVERSKAGAAGERSSSELAPRPVEDLGRPRFEPEGSRGFVPYDGGSGALASAPPSSERPRPKVVRSRPKAVRPIEAEPCDPAVIATPEREWTCGPCGRG
jgi:hypothetical protein